MQLHDLQPNQKRDKKKRVGRGGAHGKTSGRGHKGQLSRSGGTPRPQIRDRIKKIPKLRGYDNKPVKENLVAVNIGVVADVAEEGDIISPQFLLDAGVIHKEGGQKPKVKILGSGEIDIKIIIANCEISDTAREKIESAGGEVRT